VRQPQVTGREEHEADDEAVPRAQGAQHPRQDCERDSEPHERRGDHRQLGLLRTHGECLLKVEGHEHERGRSGCAAKDGERDAGGE